ncbi:degv [Trichococcus palustris]|uniref:Degv n=1 Tax=Trichococcus palustris TaxID=140314 RepID=A0A143YNC8_9LACT|nr:DegV family protein [Trichococcus palustris]CZQ93852.1 degv [Trichococcus palustris]SFK82938.1 EDD domain protein, DegV family [Trichococcus palustris]
MTKLIVDSTCDLNEAMRKHPQLEYLPLNIIIDGKSYKDGIEIDLERVYEVMRKGDVPQTSQIDIASLMEILDRNRDANEDLIYLAFSSAMSGTYAVAHQVFEMYREEYPDMKLTLIDSQGGCGGASLAAIQALNMLDKGYSHEEITQAVQEIVEHTSYSFTIANLDWLQKGGRINKATSLIGDTLNIKPLLTVKAGKIVMDQLLRGHERVYKRISKNTLDHIGSHTDQLIVISHVGDPETAQKLKTMLSEALPEATFIILRVSAVLGVHLGIGGVGVFALSEFPAKYDRRPAFLEDLNANMEKA